MALWSSMAHVCIGSDRGRPGAVSDTRPAENNEVVQILVAAASSSSDWGWCAVSNRSKNFSHQLHLHPTKCGGKRMKYESNCLQIISWQGWEEMIIWWQVEFAAPVLRVRFTNVHRWLSQQSIQSDILSKHFLLCSSKRDLRLSIHQSIKLSYNQYVSFLHMDVIDPIRLLKLKEIHFVRIKMFIWYF